MSEEHRQKNAGYQLSYEKEGVFLTVFKPLDFLSRVSEDEILNFLCRKKVHDFNASIVAEAVKSCSGVPLKIAGPQEEADIDSGIEAIVSDDKMKAFVQLTPPEGKGSPPSVEAIVQVLYSKGIVFGMSESKIRQLVAKPVYNSQVLVAEGVYPENGKDGQVKYLININKDHKPVIMEDGTVNFKDMNLIESIVKGQKLAEIIPPVPGKPGKSIVGTVLKGIDGRPAKIPKGRNVALSGDGSGLFSEIDGQLLHTDGKISVFATYEIMADVDNSTGNIKFIGNVSVRGNVLSSFEIEAGGNIEVNGVVEGATLKAGGDIILRRGMHGIGKGILIAGGDIVAKYIESCTAEAHGDIRAEAIMHSDIKCSNKLELGGRKGLLVGGTVRVGKSVELKCLGSPMSAATVLEVGVDPNLRERLKFLKIDMANLKEAHFKANQAITLLKKLESVGKLTMERRTLLAKSTRSKFYYENKIKEYKSEIGEIEEKLQQGANGRIKVFGSIYPGVRVAIGKSMLYIKEETKYCILYSDGADVRVGPL